MLNRVKQKVKREFNTLPNWNEAIREAESQLESTENRAHSLRELIKDWTARRDAGELWPIREAKSA